MASPEELIRSIRDEFEIVIDETKNSIHRDVKFPEIPNMIKVAIGMRRTGKTYVLFQVIHDLLAQNIPIETILYINFEDDRLLPMDKIKLAELLDAFYTLYPNNHDNLCYFFLDEIQNVEDWPIVIRRFLDSKKVKIYLSGSSSKLLSKEIATSLRGRSLPTEIWPYSFHEFLVAQQIDTPTQVLGKKSSDIYLSHLNNYLMTGGFPAVQNIQTEERRGLLQNYVDVVIYRDIIERYKITNIILIKFLVKSLINLSACSYSPNKFFNDLKSKGFKVSKDTVYEYISYIEDAFLAFTIPLHSESLRKTQVNPKKVYSIDSGLINAYSMSFSKNIGRMFENQFYIHLRRHGHDIYYYQTKEGYEIDFFTRDQKGKYHLHQITWDTYNKETLAREMRALKAAEKELQIKGELISPIEFLKEQAS